MNATVTRLKVPSIKECHVISFGGSMCAKFKGSFEDWPEGITHTTLDDWEKATCLMCRILATEHSQK
jgi:hypothetical protein